jgi:hypothetical protein
MKKIIWIAGIAVLMAGVAQADLVYSTDFSTEYVSGGSGAHVLGGAAPDVTAEDWFGATQGVTFGPDDLTLNWPTANRYRGSGVWLDASGWEAGTVTVGVDVSSYTAGVGGSSILFQTFAANGVDADNSVSLDLHGGPGADGDPQVVAGTSTIAIFGDEQNISGAATQEFTFTYNGTDQFIGLVFALDNDTTATTYEAATLDNLTVNTIPEPAALGLIAVFGGGLLFIRRRFMP